MKILTFLLAALTGSNALAQSVTFRSGNHSEFARLVLDIPPGTDWTIGRIGVDYALELAGTFDFDLSGAFERIPRDRLGAIEITDVPGRVILRLACPCHVSAFLFRPDKLVLDVTDGPAPPGSPWEQPIDGMPGTQVRNEPEGDFSFPLIGELPQADLTFFSPTPEQSLDALLPLDGIAEDMARAVASGLLDAPDIQTTLPAQAPMTELPPRPSAFDQETDRPGVNFITASAIDRQPEDLRAVSRTGHPCLPESDFDLAAWAPSGDFSADIGTLRASVIDEADSPDQEAITSLAKAYLHYGFGLEARQTLALTSENSATSRLIGHLADIIDGRSVPQGIFADQSGCYTPVALWSALADNTLDGRTEQERTAIETAHRILPPGPRQAVTPRLARLFLAAGHTDAAAEMMARLLQQSVATDEAVGIGSDIVRTVSSAVAARDELLAALRNGSRSGAGTIVRLVDTTIEAGIVPEPWMIETLAALRFENRGTAVATDLLEAEVRARVATGDFSEISQLLADEDLRRSPETQTRLITEFAAAIADRGSDSDFISYVFDGVAPIPEPPPTSVAARLITLGFPDVALGMLSAQVEDQNVEERRRLRADALRSLGQEEAADLLLGGLAAPPETSGNAAWQKGDWDTLRTSGDSLLSEAAEAMLTDLPFPSEDNSLATRSALISEAEATRELARRLLSRFPQPEGATTP
jgi:hypothetical protein